MKLALNGATTMRADLATDLQAAKAAGFDYLKERVFDTKDPDNSVGPLVVALTVVGIIGIIAIVVWFKVNY